MSDSLQATLFVGLTPNRLTKQEATKFSVTSKQYLAARTAILKRWADRPDRELTLLECQNAAGKAKAHVKDAFNFLDENGYINVGFFKETSFEMAIPEDFRELLQQKEATREVIQAHVFHILATANLEVCFCIMPALFVNVVCVCLVPCLPIKARKPRL